MTTASDNTSRVMWLLPDNRIAFWQLDAGGARTKASVLHGPVVTEGLLWTPVCLSVGGDGLTRVLLGRSDGAAVVWTLDGNLNLSSSSPQYGPHAGWRAIDLAVASDNSQRILWRRDDGAGALWHVSPSGVAVSSPLYGPFGGWTPKALAVGGDLRTRILWNHTDGRTDIWVVRVDGTLETTVWPGNMWGPYPGWTPLDLALDASPSSDNKARVMWKRTDDMVSLWKLSSDGASFEVNAQHGPFPGWTPSKLSVGGDGLMSALWLHSSGQVDFWRVTPGGWNQTVLTSHGPLPLRIAAPVNVSATAGANRIALAWNAVVGEEGAGVPGAIKYNIYRGESSGTYGAAPVGASSTTSFVDEGAAGGKIYFYVVRAVDAAGAESLNSSEVSGTPLSPPSAPTNLIATSGDRKITLTWSAVTGAAGYKVFRSTTDGVFSYTTPTGSPTSTSYIDNGPAGGLTNGTTYFYVVRATNTAGESGNSNQGSAVPASLPEAPTGLVATAGNGRISLAWNSVTEATSYKIFRSQTNGSFAATPTFTGTTAAYVDSGLVNGTTYFYVVKASNSAGDSVPSAQVAAIPSAQPLTGPMLTGLAGDRKVELRWTRPPQSVSYEVWRQREVQPWELIKTLQTAPLGNEPVYIDINLVNGISYTYRVRANLSDGAVLDSNSVSLRPVAARPLAPDAPTFGTTSVNSIEVIPPARRFNADSLNLYMAPGGSNGGSSSSGDEVMTLIATGVTGAFTVSGLTPNNAYHFRVEAVNVNGSTPGPTAQTRTSNLTAPAGPPAVPSAPTFGLVDTTSIQVRGVIPLGVSYLYSGSSSYDPGNSLRVQWKLSTDPDSVFEAASNSSELHPFYLWTTVSASGGTRLLPDTSYSFRLKATNPSGSTLGPIAIQKTRPLPPEAPPLPVIPAATVTQNSVVVDVPPLPARATSLNLLWIEGTSLHQSVDPNPYVRPAYVQRNVTGTTVTISGLSGGTAYAFVWQAVGPGGTTSNNYVTITTLGSAVPGAPRFANLTETSVDVVAPINLDTSWTFTLQGKAAAAPDSDYANIETGIYTDYITPRETPVRSLYPGESYTFRYLASKADITNAGIPATITLPTLSVFWAAGSPISSAGIRFPWSGMTVKSGASGRLSAYTAVDFDVAKRSFNGFTAFQALTDTCTYTWGSTAGAFDEGFVGQTLLWRAPQVSVPTDVKISLRVDDQNNGSKGRDGGDRNDPPVLFANVPQEFTVTIRVLP